MQWDLGLQGVAVLAATSLGFAVVIGLLAGRDLGHRLRAAAVGLVACFAVGLLTSEAWFGWATEEDLQPNYDGLSFDEVLMTGVVTTAVAVVIARRLGRRAGREQGRDPGRDSGRHRATHVLRPRH